MAWVTITLADLQAAKADAIVEAARTVSLADGEADPVPVAIAAVVGRIQTALRAANALDVDRTLIPAELVELAVRMAIRRLKGRIEEPLTSAEEQEAREDQSLLNRLMDQKVRFDAPANPDGATVNATAGGFELASTTRRKATREKMEGL